MAYGRIYDSNCCSAVRVTGGDKSSSNNFSAFDFEELCIHPALLITVHFARTNPVAKTVPLACLPVAVALALEGIVLHSFKHECFSFTSFVAQARFVISEQLNQSSCMRYLPAHCSASSSFGRDCRLASSISPSLVSYKPQSRDIDVGMWFSEAKIMVRRSDVIKDLVDGFLSEFASC